MSEDEGLSEAERAELERLRAEKAERHEAARAAAERAELERLRAQSDADEAAREQEAHDARARERGRKMMEPDEDDLKMAPGQKIVILVMVGVALIWLLATQLG
jgi:uncharacterized damage-inducible protein DinB